MTSFAVYALAALAEIGGCYAFWMWLRLGKSAFWLLTLSPAGHAGRAYAVYGGVYIAASLGWLWAVDGVRPDRWDIIGGAIVLGGAAIILWGPRGVS